MGKRGAPCTICTHDRRHLIEVGLTHGVAHRILGQRFKVSHHAVGRHAREHLSPQIKAGILAAQKPTDIDLDALRTSETEGLLGQLVVQRARLQTQGELALELGDVKACVAVENAITGNLTLVGKLLGQLVTHHQTTHTNILVSADYLRLRSTLIDALRPFPEAAKAVGAALHRIEAEAATDITARAGKVIDHEPVKLPPPPC